MNKTADTETSYCIRWNSVLKKAVKPLTAQEASERNHHGVEYTVLVPPTEGETWPVLVEIMWENSHAEVKFLDQVGREKASYIFQKETEYSLFLRTHYYWGYETEDPNLLPFNAVIVSEIHESPDGYLKHIAFDKKSNTKETTEYRGVPNQKNWEPVPEFGYWDSITRFDR